MHRVVQNGGTVWKHRKNTDSKSSHKQPRYSLKTKKYGHSIFNRL